MNNRPSGKAIEMLAVYVRNGMVNLAEELLFDECARAFDSGCHYGANQVECP